MKKIFYSQCQDNVQGMSAKTGGIFVISGPSGSGKSTIYRNAMQVLENIEFSVSCTTREPRAGELDGRDYHFITKKQFEDLLAEDAFAEHAEVHGNYYGTLKSELLGRIVRGIDVLLDIDVQGASQIKELCKKDATICAACTFIFIAPPSIEELKRRLTLRGTENQKTIDLRIHNAESELAHMKEYDTVIVNDDINTAVNEFISILKSKRG